MRVVRGLLTSAWALRSGPSLGEAPSLASCTKVRCLRSEDAGGKSREASFCNGLDDVRTSVGRRDVLNLALGLGSALLVGRWADKGSAAAAALPNKNTKSPFDEKRLLDQNRRMQKVNNAPEDFPNFIREGTSPTTSLCTLLILVGAVFVQQGDFFSFLNCRTCFFCVFRIRGEGSYRCEVHDGPVGTYIL